MDHKLLGIYVLTIAGLLAGWFVIHFTARLIWIFVIKGIWRAGLNNITKAIGRFFRAVRKHVRKHVSMYVVKIIWAIIKALWAIIKALWVIIKFIWQSIMGIKRWIDKLNRKLDKLDKELDAKSKDNDQSNR